jgi:hypothetical protein
MTEASVLEKHAVSVFRAESTLLGLRGFIKGGRRGSQTSQSQHHHYSLEGGDSTLLQNIGFYQPLHMAPKPRRTSSLSSQP